MAINPKRAKSIEKIPPAKTGIAKLNARRFAALSQADLPDLLALRIAKTNPIPMQIINKLTKQRIKAWDDVCHMRSNASDSKGEIPVTR